MRRFLATLLWSLGGWLGSRRRAGVGREEYARHEFRTQTRGMGLRMTERLRDRLRLGWLRLRRD